MKIYKMQNSLFTAVPHQFARRKDLPRDTKMLLVEIMGHSDDWDITVAGLVSAGTEGKSAVRRMVQQLEDAGLLHRFQKREDGAFGDALWVFGWNTITRDEAEKAALRASDADVGKSDAGESTAIEEKRSEDTRRTNDARETNEPAEPPTERPLGINEPLPEKTLDVWLIEYLRNVEVAIKPMLAANIVQQVLSTMLDRYPEQGVMMARQYLAERVIDMGLRDNVPDERALARWMIRDVREWTPSDKPKTERTVELGGFKEVF